MKNAAVGLLALTIFAHAAQPAWADVAGRYENTDKNAVLDLEMTIEADASGNARIQMQRLGSYYLFRDNVLYTVTVSPEKTTVARISDVLAVQREALERLGWKDPPSAPPIEKVRFAPMEEVVVAGRKGRAYGIISDDHKKPVYGSIVVSDDSALQGLGKAIARANTSSIKGMGSMASMLQLMNEEMLALLDRGAPIRMLSIELTDVSFDAIPAERFELPAKPLTFQEVRASSMPPEIPSPPTLPPRKK